MPEAFLFRVVSESLKDDTFETFKQICGAAPGIELVTFRLTWEAAAIAINYQDDNNTIVG